MTIMMKMRSNQGTDPALHIFILSCGGNAVLLPVNKRSYCIRGNAGKPVLPQSRSFENF